jgi:hypothetical protein
MNDAHPFATRVNAQLPDWLVRELPTYNTRLPTAADRVALTNRLAARNYKEGNGGPFAALVVDPATGVWSGIKHLLIAGDGPECEDLTGFDEGPMPADWKAEIERRGIRVTSGVLRDEAVAVFAEYGRSGAIVYNARGTGSHRRD